MSESQRRVTQPRAPRLLSLGELSRYHVSKTLLLTEADGGGVRGLSSLLILQRMMELINPNHPPKPCECFDLIGGTSTGGLIAVMLGRLRMHTSEAIDAYLKLSEDVFQPRRNQMDILARVRDRVQLRGRFDGDTLAQAVRDVVQKSGEAPEALLMEPQEGPCKVFVCSVLQEVSQPVLLRSYHSPGVASQLECKIWEACRATSAATSFFDPIRIGPFGQQFSDGATGWNNPVRQVYSEARKLWPDSKIQCLVSIGTGKPRLSAFGDDLRNIAKTLVRLATETELTAEEFLLDHADLDLAGSYFRLNVSKGLEEVGLQEYAAMSTIASATMAYLESREAFEQVTRCVHRLRAPEAKEIANGTSPVLT
ncbi:phospholipase [Schizothecium vesticola]|uniref:Phospholipase n=1 Tax=Schizothecium vesticola TaxID=314040 RepID=A0AA40K1Q2_9PEZI|nr:phospholipase [Schizothecium vesticola]